MTHYTRLLSASLAALGLFALAGTASADPVNIDPLANAAATPASATSTTGQTRNFNLSAPSVNTSAPHSLLVLQLAESLEYAIEEGDQEYISKLTKNLNRALELEAAGTPGAPVTGDNGQVSLGMFEDGKIPANAFAIGAGAPPPGGPSDPNSEGTGTGGEGTGGTGGEGTGGTGGEGTGGTGTQDGHVADGSGGEGTGGTGGEGTGGTGGEGTGGSGQQDGHVADGSSGTGGEGTVGTGGEIGSGGGGTRDGHTL